MPREGEGIVKAAELAAERTQGPGLSGLKHPQDTVGAATKGRVKNFTCPACGEVLDEAISINGVVRGWCSKKHRYVEVKDGS